MQRQVSHVAAMRGNLSAFIQCTQIHQQLPGEGECRGRRDVQPAQGIRCVKSPCRQFQGQPGQIGVEDFRPVVGCERRVRRFVPEAVTDTGFQASGPTPALVGRCL